MGEHPVLMEAKRRLSTRGRKKERRDNSGVFTKEGACLTVPTNGHAAKNGHAKEKPEETVDAPAEAPVARRSSDRIQSGLKGLVRAKLLVLQHLFLAAAALIKVKLKVLRVTFPYTSFLLKKLFTACVFVVAVGFVLTGKVLKKLCEAPKVAEVLRGLAARVENATEGKLGSVGAKVRDATEWLVTPAGAKDAPDKELTLEEKIKKEEDEHLEEIDKMGEIRKSLFHRDKRLSQLREQKLTAKDLDDGKEAGKNGEAGPKVSFHDDVDDPALRPVVDDDPPKKGGWSCCSA